MKKRLLIILIAAVMMFTLSACGGEAPSEEAPPPITTPEVTPTTTPPTTTTTPPTTTAPEVTEPPPETTTPTTTTTAATATEQTVPPAPVVTTTTPAPAPAVTTTTSNEPSLPAGWTSYTVGNRTIELPPGVQVLAVEDGFNEFNRNLKLTSYENWYSTYTFGNAAEIDDKYLRLRVGTNSMVVTLVTTEAYQIEVIQVAQDALYKEANAYERMEAWIKAHQEQHGCKMVNDLCVGGEDGLDVLKPTPAWFVEGGRYENWQPGDPIRSYHVVW